MTKAARSPTPKRPRPPAGSDRSRHEEILAAAVQTVLDQGYARTTMSEVARRAGVPRPLVQYYFPTVEALLRAAIETISSGWRDSYFSDLYADHAGDTIGISEGVDRLWAHMHQPLFKAYQELLFSARTDPVLAEIMLAAHREGERRRYDAGTRAYSSYVAADAKAYVDTSEFTAIFLEGLLAHRFRQDDDGEAVARQLALLKHLLGQYWAAHGMADAAPEAAPSSSPSAGDRAEIAALARQLIERLTPLT